MQSDERFSGDGHPEQPGVPVEVTALPGMDAVESDLQQQIAHQYQRLTAGYRPRTRHLSADGTARYHNRLFLESSPYLLQHAHNPVNWYPWGDEAFIAARDAQRPVLLSIGYSTCHWCHVMEEESFEDEDIACFLNQHYICIKVDREERPDIDAIYMSAVQAQTGSGGWPMTVWLTMERKPFYGGTYFPPRDGQRGAQIGFMTMLQKLHAIFATEYDTVSKASEALTVAVDKALTHRPGSGMPGELVLHTAAQFYKQHYDPQFGGLQGAPKFPSSYPIRFLLRYARRSGDDEVLQHVKYTLQRMAAGGICDQVGGGFHRYSTDARWLVPHFEKMLYDNALLATTYLEAHQLTRDASFARVTHSILRYIMRDMTSPEGAFYSATDADSPTPEGRQQEGWFFTWTGAEIECLLDPEDARLIKHAFGVDKGVNFEGRVILHLAAPIARVCETFKLSEEAALARIDQSLEILYQARRARPAPLRDEKIVTAWNGLMISAFARAGAVLDQSDYVSHARTAAEFVFANLYSDGRLYRSCKDGKRHVDGYLEDYTATIAAVLDLYEATFELQWLRRALQLNARVLADFEDQSEGGFFRSGSGHEDLIVRE
ncbi:MAG: thioredoxin domain-containing protein, partial [Halioglobus sp.]|nr:thioredoxin domain-containing protein [Halioglobus sp.]